MTEHSSHPTPRRDLEAAIERGRQLRSEAVHRYLQAMWRILILREGQATATVKIAVPRPC